jgi:NAD-dependent deacetylase
MGKGYIIGSKFLQPKTKLFLLHNLIKAHIQLAMLEQYFDIQIITQNIDNLHERGGSTKVLHLHGEITKSQSTINPSLVYDIIGWELAIGETCELGSQLRPFIVWFGEAVPKMDEAIEQVLQADIFVVIGTSLIVYPAASLLQYVPKNKAVYIVDNGTPDFRPQPHIQFIQQPATSGVAALTKLLLNKE